jgi:hypothetical protein
LRSGVGWSIWWKFFILGTDFHNIARVCIIASLHG